MSPCVPSNEQLGTQGDTVTAYREHLRQFMATVKPSLISYDNYQFFVRGDGDQYFLNLALIREEALKADVPLLNIIQACSWNPAVRVPNPDDSGVRDPQSPPGGAGQPPARRKRDRGRPHPAVPRPSFACRTRRSRASSHLTLQITRLAPPRPDGALMISERTAKVLISYRIFCRKRQSFDENKITVAARVARVQ